MQEAAGLALRYVTKDNKEIWLWVNTQNPAAIFWQKLGFKTVLEEKLMVLKR